VLGILMAGCSGGDAAGGGDAAKPDAAKPAEGEKK